MIVGVDVIAYMPTACLIWGARLAERFERKARKKYE
jgi:hypothetical protein